MFQSPDTIFSAHLDSGERLLWAGQPRGGIRLRGQDAFLIPFSLLWGGFAIFWEVMALTMVSKAENPAGTIFPLFGIPFVLAGLYLIFGRFIVDARARARTFYGVTDERILIRSGLFSQQTKSLPLRTITDLSLTERNDGSGTITFGPGHPMLPFTPAGGWPGASRFAPPAFDLIDDAKGVYDIIRSAQRAPA